MVEGNRTAHSTTQVFGLIFIAAALVVVVVVTLILFGGEDVGFFATLGAVAIGVTLVVRRFDTTWARILGILATLGAAMVAFFLAFGVLQPFSPLEFIVGLAFLLGVLLSLVGGIMALVAGFRDKGGPTTGETRLRTGVLGLMALAVVISIVGFLFTRSSVTEAEAAGAVVLDMVNFEFDPGVSTVPTGKQLLLTNSDAFAHDFTLEQFDIYVYFGPGSDAVVDLDDVPPGTYDYFCSLHTSEGEGMTGTITIAS